MDNIETILPTQLPLYYRYWGKSGQDKHHLLVYHSLDVAAVGYCLLDPNRQRGPSLAARLGVCSSWLRDLFSFCLMLHDLGKFTHGFQSLWPNQAENLIKPSANYDYVRHDVLGMGLWTKVLKAKLTDLIGTEHCTLLMPWLSIVFAHHGQPIEPSKARQSIRKNSEELDEQAAEQFVREIIKHWMPNLEPLNNIDAKAFKLASWQLAGIAVVADWLGSNQEYFNYHSCGYTLMDYWRRIALPNAISTLKNDAFVTKHPSVFNSINDQFPFITDATATPLQQYAQQQEIATGPQLFILEDVTGAGKTEAAMVLLHRLMAQGLAQGAYIGLPTMATANSMYQRLSRSYRKLYSDSDTPSLVLAHGASQQTKAFTDSIALQEQVADRNYNQQDNTATAYCNAWLTDNRKKALLADIGVGTIDQALLSILPARHQSLRLLGLANKVLVVDEVHAFDDYMKTLLEQALKFHSAQGGSAILLSATLPRHYRQDFITAFSKGLADDNHSATPHICKNFEYPLATQCFGQGVSETHIETKKSVKRRVITKRIDSEAAAIKIIKSAVADGKCVCWIRNTVDSAYAAYSQLNNDGEIDTNKLDLFHSRFALMDRQVIEQRVLSKFGKQSNSQIRNGQILIATQVVEQSLDLDFDIMISDLAPIDLLIQRVGRQQRHCRTLAGDISTDKLEHREPPVFYILSPDPNQVEDKNWLVKLIPGTAYVYPNIGQLWLGIRKLEQQGGFAMPEDARALIEAVYGEQTDDIPAALEQASLEAEAEQKAQRNMGKFNLLRLSMGYSYKSAAHNGGWTEDVNLPTRLGDETSEIALARLEQGKLIPYANETQYSWSQSTVKIPTRLWEQSARLIPADLQTLIEQAKQENAALKWVEVWPLTDELSKFYSPSTGWRKKEQ